MGANACRTERERERIENITQFYHFLYCISTKNEHDTSCYVFNEKLAPNHKKLSCQEDEEIKGLHEEWGG